jgi:hypothetical protein
LSLFSGAIVSRDRMTGANKTPSHSATHHT